MPKPALVIDLYAGRCGWTRGFLAAGYRSIAFDIERPSCSIPEGCDYVLQDVLTLDGAQFRNATIIVGSSPCQEFSYRAMPWKRAKALPPPYLGIELFEAQFRIQREASKAAGRHIPLVVENVCGAQKWVGRAKAHFGSYYLWGDIGSVGGVIVPPQVAFGKLLRARRQLKRPDRNFHAFENGLGSSPSFNGADHESRGRKGPGGDWFKDGRQGQDACAEGIKQRGSGAEWFDDVLNERRKAATAGLKSSGPWMGVPYVERGDGPWKRSSRGNSRKEASAIIAEIPFDLAYWTAQCFLPQDCEAA